MPRRKKEPADIEAELKKTRRHPPARTPEAREHEMISLAMDLAEERLRNGTASSAEVCHFLKLGSSRERLEQQDKRTEIELKAAKTEALQASRRIEELYTDAIHAVMQYSGREAPDEEE